MAPERVLSLPAAIQLRQRRASGGSACAFGVAWRRGDVWCAPGTQVLKVGGVSRVKSPLKTAFRSPFDKCILSEVEGLRVSGKRCHTRALPLMLSYVLSPSKGSSKHERALFLRAVKGARSDT